MVNVMRLTRGSADDPEITLHPKVNCTRFIIMSCGLYGRGRVDYDSYFICVSVPGLAGWSYFMDWRNNGQNNPARSSE